MKTNWVSAAVINGIHDIDSATAPSCSGWSSTPDFASSAEIAFLDPHDPKIGGDPKKFLRP